MPESINSVDFHQDLWNHRRNCARCSGRNGQLSYEYTTANCPLEDLITRPAPKPAKLDKNGKEIEAKVKTAPTKRPKKKDIVREDMIAEGKVEVTYPVDDDFAASGETVLERTTWVKDLSMEV
ncbi:hypothetical protein H2200_007272 [Cladophialophora chaetospira]|uniref:Uncharacterized protein n=1 Tax=Cladophialophora chaetospira TaxID=386627 RepID=A0AA38X7P5_9EURO|nr:hypothetical protein H2200_007272 [Cladophialophora chaetospira]